MYSLHNWQTGAYKTDCAEKDWLLPISKETFLQAITINTSYPDQNFYVRWEGNIQSNNVYFARIIRPVVYLIHDVKVTDGDGTYDNPYSIN